VSSATTFKRFRRTADVLSKHMTKKSATDEVNCYLLNFFGGGRGALCRLFLDKWSILRTQTFFKRFLKRLRSQNTPLVRIHVGVEKQTFEKEWPCVFTGLQVKCLDCLFLFLIHVVFA